MTKLDPQTVTDRLLFDSAKSKTEAAVILGARSVSGTLAREAAKAYHNGDFSEIIISGGLKVKQPLVQFAVNALSVCNKIGNTLGLTKAAYHKVEKVPSEDFTSTKTEADYIKQVLLEEGIPESAIVCVETSSTNTGENMRNIKEQMNDYRSVTIFTSAYHQLRALGTFRKEIGQGIDVVLQPVYPFGVTKENWNTLGKSWLTLGKGLFAGFVKGEYNKMDPNTKGSYIKKGFCTDPNLLEENGHIYANLRGVPANEWKKPKTPVYGL